MSFLPSPIDSLREGRHPLSRPLSMLCGDNDEVRTGLICVPICNYTLTLSFDIICLLLYYVQMVKPQKRGNQMGVWGGCFGVGRYATINHTSGR